MNIDITPLNHNGKVDFEISPHFKDYNSPNIIRLDNITVKGSIIDNKTDEYRLIMNITGNVVVKSAINNSEVNVPLDLKYDELVHNLVENYKKSVNSLDILPIVWENILLEIPIRATNSTDEFEIMQGNGWEIISEENK